MSSPATWTRASCIVVLAGLAFVTVSANGDPPNTGMADPAALVSAFDRFAAGGAPANVVILSLSNLRGVSSEAVNAGGRVGVVDDATAALGFDPTAAATRVADVPRVIARWRRRTPARSSTTTRSRIWSRPWRSMERRRFRLRVRTPPHTGEH